MIPLAIALSLLLGRLVHWYCRTSSYDSFEAAMKPFSPGGYALLGIFARMCAGGSCHSSGAF